MKVDTKKQVAMAESTLKLVWVIVFGAVVFSVLTVTPLVERVTPDRWHWTAPILPIVVDAAVVIVVRVDAIVARLDGRPGSWSAVLRWLTGLFTLALNVGNSALAGDMVGVGVHMVAPTLLIVSAEAALTWRRAITAAVEKIEREHAEQAERSRQEQRDREEREREDRERSRQEQERRETAEREARERAADRAREQAERERAHAAQVAREEREHAAQIARDQRDHDARVERERAEREEAARQAAAAREQEKREREQREREREQERREAAERADRDRREAAEREAAEAARRLLESDRERLVNAREHGTGPEGGQLGERHARRVVAVAMADGATQRTMSIATGWSTGWVAGVVKELREQEPIPGQTEIPVHAA